jgi:hypothetical protein
MAEYGEWDRKGAVLSDVTAQKEYGVTRPWAEIAGAGRSGAMRRPRVGWHGGKEVAVDRFLGRQVGNKAQIDRR